MIASLEFEANLHLLTFKLDKISYSVEIPHCITVEQISQIQEYLKSNRKINVRCIR